MLNIKLDIINEQSKLLNMINQQLLDYIKQQLQQGTSREIITNNLISQGWQQSDINEGFALVLLQQPERKISKRSFLAIISIIGALVIIGGSVFGYFYYFQETSEKVIEKMITRLTEVKTSEYQGDIKGEFTMPDFMQPAQQTSNKKTSNFSINFNGKYDVNDLNNPKGSFAFNIKTAFNMMEVGFDMDIRMINKVVYIKSFLSDQWIKIDTEAIKKQFEKEEQKQQELTQEQIKKIKQIVKQAKIFKVTEKLASEKIEGVDTYHYKFLIDKNELKKIIADINVVVENKTLTDKELAEIDKGFEAIEPIDGEIWIGKKDYLPYKIFFAIRIKETTESKIAGQLFATLSFKNYNKPVQIDIPQGAKPLEEFFGELFGGSFLQGSNSNTSTFPFLDHPKSFNEKKY